MIEVGQKVKFDPYAGTHAYGAAAIHCEVVGTVILVHQSHRYFTVEYELGGGKFKISFKFDDLHYPHKLVSIVK